MPVLLFSAEAAEVMGMKPATFRSMLRVARERGIELAMPREEWPDRRTPVYDLERLLFFRDVQRPNRAWTEAAVAALNLDEPAGAVEEPEVGTLRPC